MDVEVPAKVEELVTVGRLLESAGLAHGSTGNLSIRTHDGMLITPTGDSLGALTPSSIARIALDGQPLSGPGASKEWSMHAAYYTARPQAGALVHLHSVNAVAVSCLSDLDPANPIPPMTAYFVMTVRALEMIPYRAPGTSGLASAVGNAAARADALLLANHGILSAGDTLSMASRSAQEVEQAATLFLLNRGHPMRVLTDEEITDLRSRFPHWTTTSGTN